jgi:predicted transcriptional regulator
MSPSPQQRAPLHPSATPRLGEREREVMEVLWRQGAATVQQVADHLPAELAYTTVMTTLDRLYKKRLLLREKRQRAFLYRPAVSRIPPLRDGIGATLLSFLTGSAISQDALLTSLVDAVGSYDSALLEQLEEKVRIARQQMERSGTED